MNKEALEHIHNGYYAALGKDEILAFGYNSNETRHYHFK